MSFNISLNELTPTPLCFAKRGKESHLLLLPAREGGRGDEFMHN
jgi:hypothetical protein